METIIEAVIAASIISSILLPIVFSKAKGEDKEMILGQLKKAEQKAVDYILPERNEPNLLEDVVRNVRILNANSTEYEYRRQLSHLLCEYAEDGVLYTPDIQKALHVAALNVRTEHGIML